MSQIWFTSDLHYGHKLVAGHRGFGDDVAAHDAWLADMWTSTVGKDDQVWVLGDIAMSDTSGALGWIGSMPGRKHLIVGNHDQVHPMHKSAHKHMKSWMQFFDSIQMSATKKIGNHQVLLSHFPYWSYGDGPDRPTARYQQWRMPDLGLPLLHGHVHGTVQGHGNSLHVGVDAWKGFLSFDAVRGWLSTL